MSDACGIFFVNGPGLYTLNKNIGDIHDRDPTGVLARAEPVAADDSEVAAQGEDSHESEDDPAVAGQGEDSGESDDDLPKRLPISDRIEEEAGPGKRLGIYFPKQLNLKAKFSESLTPFGAFGRSCGHTQLPQD